VIAGCCGGADPWAHLGGSGGAPSSVAHVRSAPPGAEDGHDNAAPRCARSGRYRWSHSPTARLHLGALSALAIAQPLFDLISKNPDFLAARALIARQVVRLGMVLVPPLPALGVEALAGLASRALRAVLHLLFVGLLVALIAIHALKDIAPNAGTPRAGPRRGRGA
jgi:hypothetical protein